MRGEERSDGRARLLLSSSPALSCSLLLSPALLCSALLSQREREREREKEKEKRPCNSHISPFLSLSPPHPVALTIILAIISNAFDQLKEHEVGEDPVVQELKKNIGKVLPYFKKTLRHLGRALFAFRNGDDEALEPEKKLSLQAAISQDLEDASAAISMEGLQTIDSSRSMEEDEIE